MRLVKTLIFGRTDFYGTSISIKLQLTLILYCIWIIFPWPDILKLSAIQSILAIIFYSRHSVILFCHWFLIQSIHSFVWMTASTEDRFSTTVSIHPWQIMCPCDPFNDSNSSWHSEGLQRVVLFTERTLSWVILFIKRFTLFRVILFSTRSNIQLLVRQFTGLGISYSEWLPRFTCSPFLRVV